MSQVERIKDPKWKKDAVFKELGMSQYVCIGVRLRGEMKLEREAGARRRRDL